MIRFAHIEYLHLLWGIPILFFFFLYVFKRKKKDVNVFGNPELVAKLAPNASRRRFVLKAMLILAGLFFIIIALANPQVGTKLEEVKREGIDVVAALDVSLSMMAEDIAPNRLMKARHQIAHLISLLEGDRIGLIAFAGAGFVQSPLTLDYGAALMFLDAMDVQTVPRKGTAIAEAIGAAAKSFIQREKKHKVLVLFTDGEDHGEDVLKAAERAGEEGIVIYTLGVGSPQGVPIPLFGKAGNRVGFKKDKNGEVVLTRLNEWGLQQIALQTGGKYFRASPGEGEIEEIYREIGGMGKKELGAKQYTQFEDRFQIFLVIGLALLVTEFFISEGRRTKINKPSAII
ncbi:VWA domain-containing protein [candidate division KSB1 bacterium]|nr:VWA domain-containing protein [candidate division KSB1 bacterium]